MMDEKYPRGEDARFPFLPRRCWRVDELVRVQSHQNQNIFFPEATTCLAMFEPATNIIESIIPLAGDEKGVLWLVSCRTNAGVAYPSL